jgi:xylulokinase
MAVLGIDIGTQSLKATILDDGLNAIAAADQGYQPEHPRPGWAEQKSELWLAALRPVIGKALAEAGLRATDIAAVSVCGQLDGCVATDAAGRALAPAIIWLDRRATDEISHIDPRLVQGRCGLVPDATHMAAKIAWLARHLNSTGDVAMWHQPVSFVVQRLSGARAISHSLASTTMLYDVGRRAWDSELLAAFGIEERMLPAICAETDIVGTITAEGAELSGLAPGTPIVAGTGDDFSNPLGCGVTVPGIVAVSLGTAETVGAIADHAIIDPELLVETHAYPGGHYHLGNPGWLSGGAVRWAAGLLSLGTDEEFSALAATAPAGCDGLTFIPALSGAMSPKWISSARGSFIGLSPSHGREHMARAVLEGTAVAMRDVVDRLTDLGLYTGRLRLMGGGARSNLWCQIRADLTGRPADILLGGDASATGAALLAAVAAGLASDIGSAALTLRLRLHEIVPNSVMTDVYEEAYVSYRARFAALEPVWLTSSGKN